jgi:LEA14-like dessication related protein
MAPARRMRRRAVGFLVFIGVAIVAGCATFREDRIEVGLAGVALVDVSLLEQRLALTLRFQNRTDRAVAVDGLAYTLEINGQTFAKGVSNESFTVPRYGETRVDVEAASDLPAVLRQVVELQRRLGTDDAAGRNGDAKMSYRIHGRASVAGRPFGIAFDSVSELPSPRELGLPPR